MKKAGKDFLFGVLIVIAVTVCEFIVTLPFGEPWELSTEGYLQVVNREFVLTSLPAFLVTFLFARLLKTEDKSCAIKRSLIWTAVLAFNYIVIGIGNGNFSVLFGVIGIYCLLVCAFMGPVFYVKVKRF